MGHFILSLVFFDSAFDVISSVSAVDMFANLCLLYFYLALSFSHYLLRKLHFQSPCYLLFCFFFLPRMRTGWSMSIEAKSSFSFSGL